MKASRQQAETDFRQLKRAVVSCWGRLEQPEALSILRDGAQQYVAWTLQETLRAEELLEHLESASVLSPNSVGLLETLCEIVGCKEGSRLVQNYIDKHPPKASGQQHPFRHRMKSQSAPAAFGRCDNVQSGKVFSQGYGVQPNCARQFNSDLDIREYKLIGRPFLDSESSDQNWPSEDLSVKDPKLCIMSESRESSHGKDVWRTLRDPVGGGGSSMWPPLVSVRLGGPQATETEESRRRSMALWGHAAPSPAAPRRHDRPSTQAVCECSLPHAPAPVPRRRSARLATTVQQVLDFPPATATTSGGNSSGSSSRVRAGGGFAGVTPAGARRARLVDFLSRRLGPRYLQLGEQLESVTSAELAAIAGETDSDLVSRARRLLHLYLGRHGDGDVEAALVRRLRRIRFNRLADELQLWSAEQDRHEDPRDWPEDKVRWGQAGERPEDDRHRHPSPVRIARMTCC